MQEHLGPVATPIITNKMICNQIFVAVGPKFAVLAVSLRADDKLTLEEVLERYERHEQA